MCRSTPPPHPPARGVEHRRLKATVGQRPGRSSYGGAAAPHPQEDVPPEVCFAAAGYRAADASVAAICRRWRLRQTLPSRYRRPPSP